MSLQVHNTSVLVVLDPQIMSKYPWEIELGKGKIAMAMVGIINVILLETLQYLSSQSLQTKWSVICDVVGYAECKSIVQNRKYFFSSSYSGFSFTTYKILYL